MKLPGGEESNREDVKEKVFLFPTLLFFFYMFSRTIQTFRHIRLGELLRQHSTNAKLIVV